jgi:RND family efflux transporter MFP subunit
MQTADAQFPRSLRSTLFPAAILAAASLLLAACSEARPETEPVRPVVQVETVRFAPDVIERTYAGVVRARYEADEAFRVGGKIVERLVDVGDRVEAGAVLARLDTVDLALQIGSAEAEVAAAGAAAAQTAADLDRARRLLAQNNMPTAEFEHRRLALEEAEGRLARAERQLELARNQEAYATLRASAAGIVTSVAAEAGQVVAVGQPIVTIAQLDELEIEVAIPEAAVSGIEEASASVTVWANGEERHPALLRELAPQADPAARTFDARFALGDGDFRLGMTATLTLAHGTGDEVARLPLAALLDQGAGPSVYVVSPDNVLELRPVDLVRYASSSVVLAGGIADGDRVVTLGVNRLSPGTQVRTLETPILQASR